MSKKSTTTIFIEKANIIHNEKYDYSLVDYINNHTKIKIKCAVHGVFEQTPLSHLRKRGCPKCANNINLTTKEFIEKANSIHNKKYDYSLVEYKNNRLKINIICPKHGMFRQIPSSHLLGNGCPKCANNINLTTKEFIEKANSIHNKKYDYSLVKYKNSKTKVKIICKEHGGFEQSPNNHISKKYGCPKCANTKKRLRRIKEIERDKFNGNQIVPSYNSKACKLFDKMMKENNIHIQHAMNGGEYYIKELGYWVDGYDKENNIVYEFDEKYHNSEKQKNKDLIRQNEIINYIDCIFIRIKE